jgi:hypothetical protein
VSCRRWPEVRGLLAIRRVVVVSASVVAAAAFSACLLVDGLGGSGSSDGAVDAHDTGAAVLDARPIVSADAEPSIDDSGPMVSGDASPPGDYRPKNVGEAILRFTECMSRADWDQTVAQNENTNVGFQNSTAGRCYDCHATGMGGAYLSTNLGDTYDAHKNANADYVLKLVLGTVNPDGSFKDLVPAYRFRDKGLPPFGTPPHPSYILTANREQALDAFVDRTLVRFRDFTRACGQ